MIDSWWKVNKSRNGPEGVENFSTTAYSIDANRYEKNECNSRCISVARNGRE